MKKFRVVVATFNLLVSLVCGWIGVIWFLSRQETDIFQFAAEHRLIGLFIFLVGLLAVLINTAFIVIRHIYGGVPRRHVPVAGEDSDVLIAVDAVQKALTKALVAEPDLYEAEVELTYDANRRRITRVSARGTIWDGPEPLQTQLKMRTLLEKRIRELIHPETMPEFDVKIDGLKFADEGRKGKFSTRLDKISQTFRGPEYPIR